MDRPVRTPAAFTLSVVGDLVAVIVFVIIGRASHGEGILGLLITLWPFAVGLLVGHLLALVLGQRDTSSNRWAGVVVWVSTVVVGMLLRIVSGQGVQLSFVIVTVLVLGAFLLGWRFVVWLVARSQARTRG
ncbi:MAG TPA: DUF3054 domain-containing protein [Plantibacter sp.]|uniref:DUF3054 domain-containing protein n=1 Tax=unclassified Plantibacter TaxID=2624265 RepID=UPI002BFCC84F|nr:DUF3054 domain-containing protein [Plantibacter sp.]